jgi:type IV pilus assembly protein PilZ
MGIENRQNLRAPVNVWVRNTSKNEFSLWLDEETVGGDFTFCYSTQDLSEGGVFLETDTPLTVNEELNLEIGLTGEAPFQVRARVKWVRDTEDAGEGGGKPGMGLQFIDLTPESLAAVRRFVAATHQA